MSRLNSTTDLTTIYSGSDKNIHTDSLSPSVKKPRVQVATTESSTTESSTIRRDNNRLPAATPTIKDRDVKVSSGIENDPILNEQEDTFHECQTDEFHDCHSSNDPITVMIKNMTTDTQNPEAYLAQNPDFFVSCCTKDPVAMWDGVRARLTTLIENTRTWFITGNAAEKLQSLEETLYSFLDENDVINISEQSPEKLKEFFTELKNFEKEHNITPFEDICKAAMLNDTTLEMKKLFGDDSLINSGFVDSENVDIHESSGIELEAYINKKVKQHFSSLQQKASNALINALEETTFSGRHINLSPEQLFNHIMNQDSGVLLIKQWLQSNIKEQWNLPKGNPLAHDEMAKLLTEMNKHANSSKDLSAWLENPKNSERKACLHETLAIIYSQLSIKGMQENIAELSDSKKLLIGNMTRCTQCHEMLSKYPGEINTAALKELSTMSTELKNLTIKEITHTGSFDGESIYYLPEELSPENCKKLPHLKKEADMVTKKLFELVEMKNKSINNVSMSEELKLKDALLTAQSELLFKHAETKVGISDIEASKSGGENLDTLCQHIETIKQARSSLLPLLSDGKSAREKVMGVGAFILYGQEVPVSTRVSNLKLQHHLQLDGYDYSKEKSWLFDRMSHTMDELKTAGTTAYNQLKQDKVTNPVNILWRLAGARTSICDQIQTVLKKEFFDDFKELMQLNPKLARNLMGDVAQSAAIAKQIFGDSSTLCKLFEQLDWRIWGETAQSYVNDRFENKSSSYETLTNKQKESIKHMYALCQILKEAPTKIQTAKTGLDVTKDVVTGNLGNAAYKLAQGAANVFAIHKLQTGVGQMSDDEVRTLNLALTYLQSAPAETLVSVDSLRRNADSIADSIKGRSFLSNNFFNSQLMHPFTFRFNRLHQAFYNYRNGHGGARKLALELGKIGLIAGGGLGAVGLTAVSGGLFAAGLGMSSIAWSAIGFATSMTIPSLIASLAWGKPLNCAFLSAAHAIAEKFMTLDSLEAPGNVIMDIITKMRKNPDSELKQLEAALTKKMEQAFQSEHSQIKEYHALATTKQKCLDTYNNHWDSMAFIKPKQAQKITEEIDKLQTDDNASFQTQVTALQQKLKTWKALQLFIQDLSADNTSWITKIDGLQLDESIRKHIGNRPGQVPYAVMSTLEMLQEEMERELGVEFNWQTGKTKNAETGADMDLTDVAIKNRLKDYQGRILLGKYLAGNFPPASRKSSDAEQDAKKTVMTRAKKRCTEQANGMAHYLLRLGIGKLLSAQKDDTGQVDKEKFARNLKTNETLKFALAQQMKLMEEASQRCIEEHASEVHESLKQMGLELDKSKLQAFGSQDSEAPTASS